MQNLGGQTKSIMVFSGMAKLAIPENTGNGPSQWFIFSVSPLVDRNISTDEH